MNTNSLCQLVIIGNGMSAMRTVDELLAKQKEQHYQITVISSEPYGCYNRIMLSPVLSGEKNFNDIVTHSEDWYQTQGIQFLKGISCTKIDTTTHTLTLSNDAKLTYDKLIIATGSNAFIVPIPNSTHPKVMAFRTKQDVDVFLDTAKTAKHVVVIGGGLLGLEVANGFLMQGVAVTVVHNAPYLLNRQLDESAGNLLQQFLEQKGMQFYMNASISHVEVNDANELVGLALHEQQVIPADLVVMTVGVRPNIELAKQAGIHTDKGIVIDDVMQTSHANIYAVGECTEHQGTVFGLVAPLFEQAKVLAEHLTGEKNTQFIQRPTATTLKVTGVSLYSAGDFMNDDAEHLYFNDREQAIYKHLLIKDNQLIGAVLYGDTQDGTRYFDMIQQQTILSSTVRSQLMFGGF